MVLEEEYPYSYGYANDAKNFKEDREEFEGITSRDLVFLNFHGLAPLGNPNKAFVPGSRSLSWLTPYSCTLETGAFTKQTVHNNLALLKAWSNSALRSFVSFIIIPKNSKLNFQIGSASEQQNEKEFVPGGGLQFRIKSLPKETIVLTEILAHKKDKDVKKETFDLSQKFENAVQRYNQDNPRNEIPNTLGTESCTNPDRFINENFTNLKKLN
jgi:hypothetical protein